MMFVQSLKGISHNKIEDTLEEHLKMAITAFDKLASKPSTGFALNKVEPRRTDGKGENK